MLVVDANVLLYAVNDESVHHDVARQWLDDALVANEAVGLAWVVVLAFLRISTHPRIMPAPLSMDDAIDQVDAWLGAPAAVVIEPNQRHPHMLADLLRSTDTGGNLVNDAHLAALAIEHRATVVSFDRDFQRFDGLRHQVPSP